MLDLIKAERRQELDTLLKQVRSARRHTQKSLSIAEVLRIRPIIDICTAPADYGEFNSLTQFHSVPPPRLLFRRLCAVVRDRGNPRHPVIGIFALSSAVFSLAARDTFLGWDSANDLNLKRRGLDSCMQLSLCMAIPPYDSYRAARLIVALAACREVAECYKARYCKTSSGALHAIVTTSVSGSHSPMFNRIMIRSGGLFRRIGTTSGYSTMFYSAETIAAARDVVRHLHPAVDTKRARTIQLLKYGFAACGIPRDSLLRLGIRKGVYIAHGGTESLQFLRGALHRAVPDWPSASEAVAYWKRRDLPKVLDSQGTISSEKRESN
jgi:hypothetical protein